MSGCVLAFDGLVIRTRAPHRREVKYVKSWRTRKGGFAVVVMAGCDVNGRFWSVTANDSGSTHDSESWNNSNLADKVSKGELDDRFFFIGDEAFSNTQQFLTPYPGRGIGIWKDAFNFWLSHSRQAIERAFGMLVQRWGIFWRKLRFAYERWPLVINVCCKLHNFCLDRGVQIPSRRYSDDVLKGDLCAVISNNDEQWDGILRRRATGDRRTNITKKIEREGRLRPPHAIANSRS